MEEFYFSKYIFSIKGETDLLLPEYKGSTLRGGFGQAFRRIICVCRGKECSDCLLKQQCIYSWVFETPVPDDAKIMRKYPTAPHPFVIDPPGGEQKFYGKDEEFNFGLILIGKAIDYLPYFIYTFEELGRIGIGRGKGKYQLMEVTEDNPGQDEKHHTKVVYRGDDKKLAGINGPQKWSNIIDPPAQSRICLSFLTPARIRYNGFLTNDPEFHVLFRNILRRISLLSYFHCRQRLDDSGFKNLIEQAKKVKKIKSALCWKDWERYSSRQDTRMKMGGFVGEVIYEGDLEPFWPYIKLGEYIHVGKGSSFGLGKYKID
jgi:CRISPR-associated endoribonuclease Cas6